MRTQPSLAAVALLAVTACSSHPSIKAAPTLTPTASPAPVVSAAPARAFATCAAADGHDLQAVVGVTWHPSAPPQSTGRLQCSITLASSPPGGSVTLDYTSSGLPSLDVADRLKELPTDSPSRPVVALADLRIGTRAGGVALLRPAGASYLLYASTATSVISFVCILPDSSTASTETSALATTARALLTWAVSHQPRTA
jgi:hypothetical protein